MIRAHFLSMICMIVLFGAGCSGNNAMKEMDYDQTKKMVVDILQTDEGKKALQDVISEDKMKQHLVMESDVVKEAITQALVSKKGEEMWKKLFEDPKFVESFNKSISEEQKKMFKSLMNDAEFQKQMLELLQDPEMSKQTLTLLKSQQFRGHLEETIQQTLDNPLFQAKMEKLLLKAAEKKQQSEQQSGGGGGGGQSSGGSGGSSGGGGSNSGI